MLEFFVEFKNFGLNQITFSFVGTVIMGFIFSWGLYKQIKTINSIQSGKSIPMSTNIYFALHFFTFSVYGIRLHSLAMILNGLIGFLWLGVYISAGRCGDSSGKKIWHNIFLVFPIAMIFTKNPGFLMGLMYVAASCFLLQSPYEIIKNKRAGSVDLRYVLSFIANAVFWGTYSLYVKEFSLLIANIFGISVMLSVIFLYKKYKSPDYEGFTSYQELPE